jgi:uncharacterized protein
VRIGVTGSRGLIGSALVRALAEEGHAVVRLVRSVAAIPGDSARWDPETGAVDTESLAGCDAVVHLAGESLAGPAWTAERKRRVRDSRVEATRLLCGSLLRMDDPPAALLCASAVGYYGDRGAEVLREESPPGRGFLAQVCREWEDAADVAARGGIRVVRLRFGMVLSPHGGALARMLPPFRAGLGGRLGSGRQYVSWVALYDAVGAVRHAIRTPSLEGPVNVTAPHPVENREFTRILGKVLSRPAALPVPAFALRLAFGEMADELLLAGTRAVPARLLDSGYEFRFPTLEGALRSLLGK